jgi:hypothetical protein
MDCSVDIAELAEWRAEVPPACRSDARQARSHKDATPADEIFG